MLTLLFRELFYKAAELIYEDKPVLRWSIGIGIESESSKFAWSSRRLGEISDGYYLCYLYNYSPQSRL